MAPLARRQCSRQRYQQRRNSVGLCWLWSTRRHRIASLRFSDLQTKRKTWVRRATPHQHQRRQSWRIFNCQIRTEIQFGQSNCWQSVSSPMGRLCSDFVQTIGSLIRASCTIAIQRKRKANGRREIYFCTKRNNNFNCNKIIRPKNWKILINRMKFGSNQHV